MAPLPPGEPTLDLRALKLAALEPSSRHVALDISLAPGNWGTLWCLSVDPDLVARSLCGRGAAEPEWNCVTAAWR